MGSLAAWGFGLSVTALAWNLGLTWIRWPRVAVFLELWSDSRDGKVDQRIRVVVVNHGSEPISVVRLALLADEPDADDERCLDYDFDRKYSPDRVPNGDVLPAEISGHGVTVWTYEESQLRRFVKGDELVGAVTMFKTFRLVPMFLRSKKTNAYKTVRSRQRVVRS